METFGKRDRVLENPKEPRLGARKATHRSAIRSLSIFLKGEARVTSPIIAECLFNENWACTAQGHAVITP